MNGLPTGEAINALQGLLEQVKDFVVGFLPDNVNAESALVGLLILAAGIVIGLVGAKVVRSFVTLVFVGLGGYLGYIFAVNADVPPAPAVVGGGALMGVVGYMTFRVWIGIMASVAVTGLVLAIFSYAELLPHVESFIQDHPLPSMVSTDGADGQTNLSAEGGKSGFVDTATMPPSQWLSDLGTYASAHDEAIGSRATALAIAVAMVALLLGVLATRQAAVVATSLLGVLFVTVGLFSLAANLTPSFYESMLGHPALTSIGFSLLLMTSMFMQSWFAVNKRAAEATAGGDDDADD